MADPLHWHEWLCHTNFSFLMGASHPEEYVERAVNLGYAGLGISDLDGLYGIVRAYRKHSYLQSKHTALAQQPLRLYFGVECHLAKDHHLPVVYRDTLTLYATNRQGYQTLCQLINRSHQDSKHEASLALADLLASSPEGLIAIQPMRGLIRRGHQADTVYRYQTLRDHFQDRFYLTVSRHLNPTEDAPIHQTLQLAKELNIPWLPSQDAFFHAPERKNLSDVLHAIRLNQPLKQCAAHLFVNHERCLRDPSMLAVRYGQIPGFAAACRRSRELAERFDFCLSQLQYHYPREMIPSDFTAQSYLEFLVWQATYRIYPNPPPKLVATLQQELTLIAHLEFADYFLTVWDIVRWARSQNILCQGRGSAANSAICFVLGITAVDPSLFDLLFERFISLERGDPPDIDVDFEHERREEVIQYIYQRYGRQRAAMVANVITFRRRGALRAVGKALAIPEDVIHEASQMQRLRHFRKSPSATSLEHLAKDGHHENELSIPWQVWADMVDQLKGFPRHLGIHSGGFIISDQPLTTIVPQEPATMEKRTVVQWSKDDIEALGLFKIDILALGMLTVLRKCFTLIQQHDQQRLDLATLPHNDAETYQMIQRAQTVGTFQIESRAQMSMLPRLRPAQFYDLVVQVGIIRPGPIQGGLIHPYLRRRHGLEPVEYPHPKLKPILQRTLGVPIFQEQIMRLAMTIGDFTAGEADQLRKQIGSWSLQKDLGELIQKLEKGMLRHGIALRHVRQVLDYLKGFADYGFPESHAASFALLAYASSYLKCHYQEAFYTALLNSQPLGFYSVHALIQSARREGSEILPISLNQSAWESTLAPHQGKRRWAIRLGLHLVRGLTEKGARDLLDKRHQKGAWRDLNDFLYDQPLHRGDLTALTAAGALQELGVSRREALWLAEAAPFAPLLDTVDSYPFTEESPSEAAKSDFAAFGSTLGRHPSEILKEETWSYPVDINRLHLAKDLTTKTRQQIIDVFGMVLVRQAPTTAKGMVFFTLEDETGFLNLAFPPPIGERYHHIINKQGFLCVRGVLQLSGNGCHSILVQHVYSPQQERPNLVPLHQASETDQTSSPASENQHKSWTKSRNYM
jgi:error-prone DNA polymerase